MFYNFCKTTTWITNIICTKSGGLFIKNMSAYLNLACQTIVMDLNVMPWICLKFTKLDPGAIYQVRIAFSMADVNTYPCQEERRVAAQTLANRDGFTSINE